MYVFTIICLFLQGAQGGQGMRGDKGPTGAPVSRCTWYLCISSTVNVVYVAIGKSPANFHDFTSLIISMHVPWCHGLQANSPSPPHRVRKEIVVLVVGPVLQDPRAHLVQRDSPVTLDPRDPTELMAEMEIPVTLDPTEHL